MTGKFMTIVLASALIAGGAGVAIARNNNAEPQQPDREAMRATHALNMLEAQGYARFADFTPAGKDFTADVTKNGKTFEVLIDPSTNQIQPQIVGKTGSTMET